MRGIERRIVLLEDRRRLREGSFGHLTDEELLTAGISLIERINAAGIAVPLDWREQFNRDPAGFLRGLSQLVKESIECVR